MGNLSRTSVLFPLVLTLWGCGASLQAVRPPGVAPLSTYRNLYLAPPVISGALSGSANALANASVISVSAADGAEHANVVFEQLKFELLGLGFRLVDHTTEADAIVAFTIGTIRYDPVGGWIADQGLLRFTTPSGDLLAQFRAKSQVITPSTEKIVNSLVAGVANSR